MRIAPGLIFVFAASLCHPRVADDGLQLRGQQVAIGRFSLVIPDGVEITSREQIIYGARVWTSADPWRTRLDALGAGAESRPELGDGIDAVWYEEHSVRLLEAAKADADHSVYVRRDAPKGKEAVAEELVGRVIRGYAPSLETGFCLEAGAIRLGPAQIETTRLHLRLASDPETTIELITQTTARPDEKQYMSSHDEREVMAGLKGQLQVFTEQSRTVAGLSGVELQLSMAAPKEPEIVRYTWHFPGVAGSGTQPKVTLVAFTSPKHRAELTPVWDTLLGSLRPVPVGERQAP